jgi:hypothetical protein
MTARPDARQRAWANQRHVQPTAMQTRQRDTAMRDPSQRFKSNQGRPAVFATQHAGNFTGPHAVRAPASANNRKAGASERARPAAAAPGANRRMMQAPHDRARPATAAPSANRRMQQAPHDRAQASRPVDQSFRQERTARPTRERGTVQAPRERPQQTRQVRQPNQSFRQERAAPPRSESRQPAARRAPPPHSSERGQARPDKKHDNNGPGHH